MLNWPLVENAIKKEQDEEELYHDSDEDIENDEYTLSKKFQETAKEEEDV